MDQSSEFIEWQVVDKPTWFLYRWTGMRSFSITCEGHDLGGFSTNSDGNGALAVGQYELRTHGDLPLGGVHAVAIRSVTIYDESTGKSVADGRRSSDGFFVHLGDYGLVNVFSGTGSPQMFDNALAIKHPQDDARISLIEFPRNLDQRTQAILLGLALYLSTPSEWISIGGEINR